MNLSTGRQRQLQGILSRMTQEGARPEEVEVIKNDFTSKYAGKDYSSSVAKLPLSDFRKQHLLQIVDRMEAEGAPAADVGVIFQDFVSKYQGKQENVAPVPMNDRQLQQSLAVQQPKNSSPEIIEAPVDFYNNARMWDRTGRTTGTGIAANTVGQAALGFLQGATGGAAKKVLALSGNDAATREYDAAGERPAFMIGDLAGGIVTGNQIGKAVSKIPVVSRLAASRKLPAKAAAFIARSTAEGAPWIVQEGIDNGLSGVGKEAATNLAFDTAFGGAGQLVKKGVQAVEKPVKTLLTELSGISEEAYKNWNNPEARQLIMQNLGKQKEIATELVDRIQKFDEYLPDYHQVEAVLENMPPMHIKRLQQQIELFKVKNPVFKQQIANNKGLKEVIDNIADVTGADWVNKEWMPATQYKELLKGLDDEIGAAWGKESASLLTTKLKQLRHTMGEELENAAMKSGNTEYVDIMRDYRKKLDARAALQRKLGQAADVQMSRSERFIDLLHGKNKTEMQELVGDLDKIFGDSDLLQRSKYANLGKQLHVNEKGQLPYLPVQTTGRTSLGINAGRVAGAVGGFAAGAMGGIGDLTGIAPGFLAGSAGEHIGGAIGAAVSSPRIANAVYATNRAIKKRVENLPKYLRRPVRELAPYATARNLAKTRYLIGDLTNGGR
jgi:hypothetical protein